MLTFKKMFTNQAESSVSRLGAAKPSLLRPLQEMAARTPSPWLCSRRSAGRHRLRRGHQRDSCWAVEYRALVNRKQQSGEGEVQLTGGAGWFVWKNMFFLSVETWFW